ncbi:MAG: epoxyqueuosine reductase QueH [Lachnospiraceae bacterium]|nr:epoxyqueuosine reductase QueH [Lachnospiraceae bacterium]
MINYSKELEKLTELIKISKENDTDYKLPKLLLHACCAPCSSYCLEYLSEFFNITVLFYNPNITETEEYIMRKEELKKFITVFPFNNKVNYIEGDYEPDVFFEMSAGLEDCPEGGNRCFKCYEQRLRKTAIIAKNENYDYFCTTLSISPLKNAARINEIGYMLQNELDVLWLPSDFKKKNGYKRSIELSAEYNLYRQNYCGCIFSKK